MEAEGNSTVRFKALLERTLREHASILKETKGLVEQVVRDPSWSSVTALLVFYDSVVMDHARMEEESLVPSARKEGMALDGEALRFAHSTLQEAADSLRNSMDRGRGDRYIQEAQELERLLRDHFYEEENFLFVSDPEDIFRNSGSY